MLLCGRAGYDSDALRPLAWRQRDARIVEAFSAADQAATCYAAAVITGVVDAFPLSRECITNIDAESILYAKQCAEVGCSPTLQHSGRPQSGQ